VKTLNTTASRTDQTEDIVFERGVVTLFRVIEMDEEEDVRPNVVLVVDVVVESLEKKTTSSLNFVTNDSKQ